MLYKDLEPSMQRLPVPTLITCTEIVHISYAYICNFSSMPKAPSSRLSTRASTGGACSTLASRVRRDKGSVASDSTTVDRVDENDVSTKRILVLDGSLLASNHRAPICIRADLNTSNQGTGEWATEGTEGSTWIHVKVAVNPSRSEDVITIFLVEHSPEDAMSLDEATTVFSVPARPRVGSADFIPLSEIMYFGNMVDRSMVWGNRDEDRQEVLSLEIANLCAELREESGREWAPSVDEDCA
jgi:hypothetical protein